MALSRLGSKCLVQPVLRAYLVLRFLKRKEEYPDIKIILMSGCDWYGIDAEFEVAKSLGALTLKKPFERKIIRQAINQIQNLILFGICFLSIS